MTIAEWMLVIFLVAAIYSLLRPLQQAIERFLLKLLGREPKWIDADVVSPKDPKKEP